MSRKRHRNPDEADRRRERDAETVVDKIRAHRARERSRAAVHDLDEIAANELTLYIENTSELYGQRRSIESNVDKKIRSGRYDPSKAPRLWLYWVDAGAKRYVREFGGDVRTTFPKKLREHVARELAREFEDLYLAGNWNPPKKNPRAKMKKKMTVTYGVVRHHDFSGKKKAAAKKRRASKKAAKGKKRAAKLAARRARAKRKVRTAWLPHRAKRRSCKSCGKIHKNKAHRHHKARAKRRDPKKRRTAWRAHKARRKDCKTCGRIHKNKDHRHHACKKAKRRNGASLISILPAINPSRGKKRRSSKKGSVKRGQAILAAFLRTKKVGQLIRYTQLPEGLRKNADVRACGKREARFAGVPLSQLFLEVVNAPEGTSRVLAEIGEQVRVQYKASPKSKRAGPIWDHAAGDHGRGKKKTRAPVLAFDVKRKTEVLVARRGTRRSWSSSRGLVG